MQWWKLLFCFMVQWWASGTLTLPPVYLPMRRGEFLLLKRTKRVAFICNWRFRVGCKSDAIVKDLRKKFTFHSFISLLGCINKRGGRQCWWFLNSNAAEIMLQKRKTTALILREINLRFPLLFFTNKGKGAIMLHTWSTLRHYLSQITRIRYRVWIRRKFEHYSEWCCVLWSNRYPGFLYHLLTGTDVQCSIKIIEKFNGQKCPRIISLSPGDWPPNSNPMAVGTFFESFTAFIAMQFLNVVSFPIFTFL